MIRRLRAQVNRLARKVQPCPGCRPLAFDGEDSPCQVCGRPPAVVLKNTVVTSPADVDAAMEVGEKEGWALIVPGPVK